MIVVIDYGMGNVNSILTKLERLGADAMVSGKFEDIEAAEKLIHPGVGAFDAAMANLEKYGLRAILDKKVVRERTPILGICLGMQLFSKNSEEGRSAGLGWIDSETKRFSFEGCPKTLKIPHMGWNTIRIERDCGLLEDIADGSRFYFVHSYNVCCKNDGDRVASTNYGYDFTSILHRENIYGVQFHPEKSHNAGIRMIKNFISLS
jgi:imidazole glycerol-phosphate synthase subunit HisH